MEDKHSPNCSTCGQPTTTKIVDDYDVSPMLGLAVHVEGMPLNRCPDGHTMVSGAVLNHLSFCLALLLVQQKHLDGSEIRFLRKFLGKTQSELAEVLEVDKQTIGRWERNGGTETPCTFGLRFYVADYVSKLHPTHPLIEAAMRALREPTRRTNKAPRMHTITSQEACL